MWSAEFTCVLLCFQEVTLGSEEGWRIWTHSVDTTHAGETKISGSNYLHCNEKKCHICFHHQQDEEQLNFLFAHMHTHLCLTLHPKGSFFEFYFYMFWNHRRIKDGNVIKRQRTAGPHLKTVVVTLKETCGRVIFMIWDTAWFFVIKAAQRLHPGSHIRSSNCSKTWVKSLVLDS